MAAAETHTVGKRAVRILLECFLVLLIFFSLGMNEPLVLKFDVFFYTVFADRTYKGSFTLSESELQREFFL